MTLIIAIIAIIAGQRYLGIGDWIWWLFGINIVIHIIEIALASEK